MIEEPGFVAWLLKEWPFLALFVSGQAGMIAHWLKRWAKDQTDLGMRPFFRKHRKSAFGSMLVMAATIVGMMTFSSIEVTVATVATAFLMGFNLNSVFTPHDPADPKVEPRK